MWTKQTEMTSAEVAGQAKGKAEPKRKFLNCRKMYGRRLGLYAEKQEFRGERSVRGKWSGHVTAAGKLSRRVAYLPSSQLTSYLPLSNDHF